MPSLSELGVNQRSGNEIDDHHYYNNFRPGTCFSPEGTRGLRVYPQPELYEARCYQARTTYAAKRGPSRDATEFEGSRSFAVFWGAEEIHMAEVEGEKGAQTVNKLFQ